jgi:hypothetical protein
MLYNATVLALLVTHLLLDLDFNSLSLSTLEVDITLCSTSPHQSFKYERHHLELCC